MAAPRIAHRLSRLAARAYGGRPAADEIAAFLDDAVAHAWAARRGRGVVSVAAVVARDLLRVWTRGAALPISSSALMSASDRGAIGHLRSTMIERLLTEFRHARRALLRTPGVTAIAVLTLALGIGASTAVYAVVDGAILRPFSYPDMRSIALLSERNRQADQGMSVSWPNFLDWRERNDVFRELGVYRSLTLNMRGGETPERVNGALVSASVFQTMGIAPLRGRVFTAADNDPGVSRIAIVSDRLWRTHLDADPGIIGRTLRLNDEAYSIVGVMPAAMRFPSRLTDVWLPVGLFVDTFPPSRGAHPGLTAVGRLRDGVSVGQASAAMDVIARQLEAQYPDTNRGNAIVVDAYYDLVVGDIRPAMQMLLVAVALLLLIACTNLTGLLLARAEERRADLAIRAALGAGRGRLVRQLLVEAGMLAAAGGLLGVLLAHLAVRLFVATEPSTIPRIDLIGIDWRVLAFAALVSLSTVVLFGALPAVRASRPNLQHTLRDVRGGSSTRAQRTRSVLVAAQIAVAVVLLVGAGLLIKSLTRLLAIDVGFDASQVMTMRVAPAEGRYPTPEAWTSFYDRLLEGLSSAPGVQAAGINSLLPFEGGATEGPVMKEGDPAPSRDGPPPVMCMFQTTGGRYFDAMGIPVIRGRTFDGRDRAGGPPVAIVDESLVARLFPAGENPVGHRIAFEAEGNPFGDDFRPLWREIVGVVGTVKHYGLLSSRPYVQVYVPHTQLPTYQQERRPAMVIAARLAAPADADAVVQHIRGTVAGIDPTLPVYGVRPMRQYVDADTEGARLASGLLAAFAALALTLAVVGVYGMLSYVVALRRREIGVRMALGARRGDILRQVIGQGIRLAGIGMAVGVAVAVALSRYVDALLYQVSPLDAAVYAAVCVALAAVAAVASAIPARRASTVDPLAAVRDP